MTQLMRFPSAAVRDARIEAWWLAHQGELGEMAQRWFRVMRGCGGDVLEVLHDGQPTCCVGDAAFCYVDAFKAHVNVGFFRGAQLSDPAGRLEGTGKLMRHVKLRPGSAIDADALEQLIKAAYDDMRVRVAMEAINEGNDSGSA